MKRRYLRFLTAIILGFLWLMSSVVIAQEPQSANAPSCRGKYRGLGIAKVKAGDDHCGLVSRVHKRAALDAACTLAEAKRDELQARARERAESKCSHISKHASCRCEGELRRWENVYTNHLSGRCWSECGWAYVIECDRAPEPSAEPDG